MLFTPAPKIIVTLQAIEFEVSMIFQVSVPPAVGKVFPARRYTGVVEIVLGAAPSIVALPKLLVNT